jgi:hypothetical protein
MLCLKGVETNGSVAIVIGDMPMSPRFFLDFLKLGIGVAYPIFVHR